MIDSVDKRLWSWAEWTHKGVNGLGYASTTTEYRLAREGAVSHSPPCSRVPSFRIDHACADVNQALRDMYPRWAEVVKARYLCGMSDKDGAAFLRVSLGTFRRDLDLVHAYLAGRWRLR